MQIRSFLALTIGKLSRWFLQTFLKGGSSFPGKLALKIDPHILDTLARDYEVVVVTGTNGKTLTTALTVNILKQKYDHVLTNPTGANLVQGIVSTFLSAKKSKDKRNLAVLEIDEATLSTVTKYITPDLFLFTNIFSDQMDRYAESKDTYQLIVDGANNAPDATILANGDLPLFNSLETKNPRRYYGFNHQAPAELRASLDTDGILCPHCQQVLHYHLITYSNLGDYYCPNCDFKRPELAFQLTELSEMTPTSARFTIDQEEYQIAIGGLYNVYNALAATAVAEYYDVTPTEIRAGLAFDEQVFGRQETIHIGNKACQLILVKNPVGLNQVIDMMALEEEAFSLVTLLNANYADGIDTSWIWSGHFERLKELAVPQAIVGGERKEEMAFRLEVAGFAPEEIKTITELNQLPEEIKKLPTNKVYLLATYTAVLQLRKLLTDLGYIKGVATDA